MTDKLRLGTLSDEIFAKPSLPRGDSVLQGGISIPTPPPGGPPAPIFAAADDLPSPPHPYHYGGDLPILYGGISIPTP